MDRSIKDRARSLRAEFDVNKDGKLDDTERTALRSSMEQELIKKFDKNGDGKIDADEHLAIRKEIHQKMKSCKEGHDKRRGIGGPGPGKPEDKDICNRDHREICKRVLERAASESPEQIKQKPMLSKMIEKCKATGTPE